MANKRICDLEITDDIVHAKIAEIDSDRIIAELDTTICQFKINDTIDKTVFVVTYWDNGLEPVVTVFDNQENAEKCYLFFKEKHDGCCIDEVPLYKHFGKTGE